jgi:hypothetical protein
MISKLSWIFFVPFAGAAVFLMLARSLMADGAILGMSDMMLGYAAIGCAAAAFLVTLILCLCDRKISPYYQPHRNFVAGILGLLLAVAFAADGANRIYNALSAGTPEVLDMIEAGLLLISSVVFIVIGLTHSFVTRDNRALSLINVIPALLCAVRLVRCFVDFTTISITVADVPMLFCYIFATLFFFNFAVAISMTEAKNAVKSCFIYGFPAVTMLAAYGVSSAYDSFNPADLFANIPTVELLLMAAYILAFLAELTIFSKDRDHVVIAGNDDEYRELTKEDTEMADDFVVTGLSDDDRPETASSYLTGADTSGYIYTEQQRPDEPATKVMPADDASDYITNVVANDNDTKTGGRGYSDRLDEIDKLILEISGDIE